MSRKAKQAVEAVASATTRRGFLGRFARLAAGAAAAAASLLTAGATRANEKGSGKPQKQCCYYLTIWGDEFVRCVNSKDVYGACADPGPGTYLVGSMTVDHCREC